MQLNFRIQAVVIYSHPTVSMTKVIIFNNVIKVISLKQSAHFLANIWATNAFNYCAVLLQWP